MNLLFNIREIFRLKLQAFIFVIPMLEIIAGAHHLQPIYVVLLKDVHESTSN